MRVRPPSESTVFFFDPLDRGVVTGGEIPFQFLLSHLFPFQKRKAISKTNIPLAIYLFI